MTFLIAWMLSVVIDSTIVTDIFFD